MKKILFLTIIAMSFILFGCNKQELIEENKQSEIPEPVEENKEPEIPVIDWTYSRDPNLPTFVEDMVGFVTKREYIDKIFTKEDFLMLEIEEIECITLGLYNKYLEEGKVPETFNQVYYITLKNKGEQYVYEAINILKNLEFILFAEPNYYVSLE